MKIPSWDEFFFRHVYLAASKSKDQRTKIGAILVKENRIIAEGFNGLPVRLDDSKEERQGKEIKPFYFEHGERNAVFSCAFFGISSRDSIMYTQGLPCPDCARAIIMAGVKEVVIHKQWTEKKGPSSMTGWRASLIHSKIMLDEAKVNIRLFDMFLGVQGMSDGIIYEL